MFFSNFRRANKGPLCHELAPPISPIKFSLKLDGDWPRGQGGFLSFLFSRTYLNAELGTQQHCRDNETMFPGQTIVDYCLSSIFFAAALHLDIKSLKFVGFFLVIHITLSHAQISLKVLYYEMMYLKLFP